MAALPEDAATADELLRQADRAPYAAKRGGRNRVEVATRLPEHQDADADSTHAEGPEPQRGSWPSS